MDNTDVPTVTVPAVVDNASGATVHAPIAPTDIVPAADDNVPASAKLTPVISSQLLEPGINWKTLQKALNLTPRKEIDTVGSKKGE